MSSPLTPGSGPGYDQGGQPGGQPTHVGPTTTQGASTHGTPATHGSHDTRDAGTTQQFGDIKVSSGAQAAYVTLELILYVITAIAIFVTAAVIDEDGSGQGFGASEAWFYVTLLTVGLFISRGLAKIGQRGNDGTRTL